jgi:ribosomal-protein-alanine N-acetyltransferase
VKVRQATLDDLGGLVRLEEECFGAEKFSEATLKAFLVRDDAFAIVADEGGVVGAALCLCSKSRAEGRIASIAVAGRERRKGVATSLLRETEAALEGRGARTFGLEVEVENGPAIALYTKHGYTLRAIVRDYYGAGRHAYVMEKVLPSNGRRVSVRPS